MTLSEIDLGNHILHSCCSRYKCKRTSSGWYSFNAVCCTHNGETADTRGRAGMHLTSDGGVVYSCFNCRYSASWKPGILLSKRMKDLLSWMNFSIEEIRQINFMAWKTKKNVIIDNEHNIYTTLSFDEISLPDNTEKFSTLLNNNCDDENFIKVANYVCDRGMEFIEEYDFMWSNTRKNEMNKRVIIPFYWENKIVGYTARSIEKSKYRYYTEVHPDYIFNTEIIKDEHEYIIVTEGPFDAIAANGVATLGDKITQNQINWLNQQGKNIIILPDRIKNGGKLLQTALEQNWFVSFPKWDKGVKDAADALKKYGKLYTLWSIMKNITNNKLEINVRKQLEF